MARKTYYWKLNSREVALGERTVIVGVLNVTPDSFPTAASIRTPTAPLPAR